MQILNSTQIQHRIDRIAHQVLEDNMDEKELYIAGVVQTGYELAQRIKEALQKICDITIHLMPLEVDKQNQASQKLTLPVEPSMLKDKTVIVVDDVLNSGKTLTYALIPFLNAEAKKIRTILLIDRDHKRYPVYADYVGLRLSTTMKEHVSVSFVQGKEEAVIS